MASNDYKKIELLGTGAFAQTWRVKILDEELREEWHVDELAMKQPLNRYKPNALRKEVELNAGLFLDSGNADAENLTRYYGFDVYEDQIVLLTEYVKGGDLRSEIGQIGKWKTLEEERTVEIIKGVLKGLRLIHSKHIMHRDIKPENILLEGGIPKITDFGISRFLGTREFAKTTTGTLFYMSPEILLDDDLNGGAKFNTDIWSVGVLFYEMLYGKFPFGMVNSMGPGSIVAAILNCEETLEFPEGTDKKSPVNIIISKALTKNINKRYQSAHDMITDLDKISDTSKKTEEPKADTKGIEEKINEIIIAGTSKKNKKQIEDALMALRKDYPRDVRLYRAIGELNIRHQDFENAIKFFLKGVACCSTDALCYWGLGVAHMKIKDDYKAVMHFKHAIELGLDTGRSKYANLIIDQIKKQGKWRC